MRLISAHCSTPTTRLLLARADARARLQTQPDTPDPAPGGSLFNRRRWVSIQAAPTMTTGNVALLVVARPAGATKGNFCSARPGSVESLEALRTTLESRIHSPTERRRTARESWDVVVQWFADGLLHPRQA